MDPRAEVGKMEIVQEMEDLLPVGMTALPVIADRHPKTGNRTVRAVKEAAFNARKPLWNAIGRSETRFKPLTVEC